MLVDSGAMKDRIDEAGESRMGLMKEIEKLIEMKRKNDCWENQEIGALLSLS
jgi:hypothetical protein